MEAPKEDSTSRSKASRWPRSPTMRWLPGTRILTWVDATGFTSIVPGGRLALRRAIHTPDICRAVEPVLDQRRLRSAGWPAEVAASDHMQVQVRHEVAGIGADVENQPVPALRGWVDPITHEAL